MLGGEISQMFESKEKHHYEASSELKLAPYQRAEDIPMTEARRLLSAHVGWAYHEFRALGAPDFDVSDHIDRFFGHLPQVLPPEGAYFLAHGADGHAVGTGALRRVSRDTAEMKHLYVSPEVRGRGLGRRLIEARIAAARALGVKTLVADTFRGNVPMINLYRTLGFQDAAPYNSAVASITPQLIPHLHYFRMELGEAQPTHI